LILFILDTTLSPSSSYNDLRSRQSNHFKPQFKNGNALSPHTSATDKGFGRVSKGLILLCVFIGCISLFLLHTRRDLPYLNLGKNDEETHSNKNIPQSKDYTSFPFKGSNQALPSDEEGMPLIFPTDKRRLQQERLYLPFYLF
jgi:hypothetical protein